MKKLFTIICLVITFMLLSPNANAQEKPFSLSASGGYSWLTGVVGGEAQFGNWGLGGGWMPVKMPMSGEKINSIGLGVTYYTLPAGQEGTSLYASLGFASQGYQYQDSWGGEETLPVTIVMVGTKYDTGGVWLKGGLGYGWCEALGAFTFEITLGLTLFGN